MRAVCNQLRPQSECPMFKYVWHGELLVPLSFLWKGLLWIVPMVYGQLNNAPRRSQWANNKDVRRHHTPGDDGPSISSHSSSSTFSSVGPPTITCLARIAHRSLSAITPRTKQNIIISPTAMPTIYAATFPCCFCGSKNEYAGMRQFRMRGRREGWRTNSKSPGLHA